VLQKQTSQGFEQFQVGHLQLSPEEVHKRIKSAIHNYKLIKKQSNRRDIWVAQMITAQAKAHNIQKTKLWKRLQITTNGTKSITARKVKQALGKIMVHTGLSQVTALVSHMGNTRITITTKEELEKAYLEEAQRCFTQVAQTPLLQTPAVKLLGLENMDSPTFHQILHKTFECPPGCDPYLCKLLPYLAQMEHIPEITMGMYKEYKKSWEQA